MQGAKRAVWQATQAICNEVARQNPASQMSRLLTNRLLVKRFAAVVKKVFSGNGQAY
jgi:hypothetical protein